MVKCGACEHRQNGKPAEGKVYECKKCHALWVYVYCHGQWLRVVKQEGEPH